MAFWFNVDSKKVETDETRSQDANVLGPYDTEADAAAALQRVEENNEEWDSQDKAWDAQGASSSWDDSDLED